MLVTVGQVFRLKDIHTFVFSDHSVDFYCAAKFLWEIGIIKKNNQSYELTKYDADINAIKHLNI